MTRESLQSLLAPFGQDHVLRFWDELSAGQRATLASQIQGIDLDQLTELVAGRDVPVDYSAMAAAAIPPPAVMSGGGGEGWSHDDARSAGEQALRNGEVGAILVAGGQGTRLGFDQPKGMFQIGPVSGRTLFQMFADRLRAVGDQFGRRIPLYVMTSDATDEETRAYFAQQDYLGLDRQDVHIFRQGTMPAVDSQTGKLLMSAKHSLALSPDGHGGTAGALDQSGSLDDAAQRGINYFSYIQVDNPLAALCDPVLLGHHVISRSEMTTQVIRKRTAMERVGNVVSIDGRAQIIEYSDLPQQPAEATGADGSLRLWAGNIAVHVVDLEFFSRLARSTDSLPFHRAHKGVACLDEGGSLVQPTAPNATKFERFIFDMLPSAQNALVVEALPSEAFAPVKNAEGAETDTPSLARLAISDLHRSWLQAAGVMVDEGILVEIDPGFSLSSEGLREKIPANLRISSNRYLTLE